MRKPKIQDAIKALDSDAIFTVRDGVIEWHENTSNITDSQIQAKLTELTAAYDAQEYARSRATEYPSIQEQLDLQYWDKVNSTSKWDEAVKAIKDKHPKG